jgi:uncharacterized protein (DUF488 family)
MKLFTIGFTRKNAERFFGLLRTSGAQRVVDVRLNNVSQLSGFAKKEDLRYFLRVICGMGYVHLPDLAPTQELLDEYKRQEIDWATYEKRFLRLLRKRRIEVSLPRSTIADACLLCSESEPEHCHRRLVAEYLRDRWGEVEVVHLT